MSRKQWMIAGAVVSLAALSLYVNRDWFAKDTIQIYHRSKPARAVFSAARKRPDASAAINPIFFGFNAKVHLTSVKVVVAADLLTNKYPHALWHLVSESNSVPLKDFSYGSPIPGMRPAVKGLAPEPLSPGVGYTLLIEATDFKGSHDFIPVPRTP
jgi:hypothetical protein